MSQCPSEAVGYADTDVPGRCDESVMDWKCTEAIVIRCSKCPQARIGIMKNPPA
jgi:hypothetical protein